MSAVLEEEDPVKYITRKDGSAFPDGKLKWCHEDFIKNGWIPWNGTYISQNDHKLMAEAAKAKKLDFVIRYGQRVSCHITNPVEDPARQATAPEQIIYELKMFSISKAADKERHFWTLVKMLINNEYSGSKFDRHPWAEKMIAKACKHKYLGVAGCAASGKSACYGLWACISWLCSPHNTMVIVASTTQKDAEKRIWGYTKQYFNAIKNSLERYGMEMPGKLLASDGCIAYEDEKGVRDERAGITLLAADRQKGAAVDSKIFGFHNEYVLLILDEMTDLADSVNKAASNLNKNPHFQQIGLANPSSYFDAFGQFVKPAAGWEFLHEELEGWRTTLPNGYCLRLDGAKSPNVLAGRVMYDYLITEKSMQEDAIRYGGEKSAGFYRMNRGWFTPAGAKEAIYHPIEIIQALAFQTTVRWKAPPVALCFADPSFTTGGDRFMARIGQLGETLEGKNVLLLGPKECIKEDTTNKERDPNFQRADGLKKFCLENGVNSTFRLAIDCSGGHAFASILATVWDNGFLRVQFKGVPSEVDGGFGRLAKDEYEDVVSEIWYAAKAYMQAGQLKGVDDELSAEMCARTWNLGARKLIKVEEKKKMKGRLGFSPDLADASLGVVFLARVRFQFRCSLKLKRPELPKGPTQDPITQMVEQAWGLTSPEALKKARKLPPPMETISWGGGDGWGDDYIPN